MQDYEDRDTDIHTVNHVKSGTTLTQMLLYQFTTDGNMDFKHLMIYRRSSGVERGFYGLGGFSQIFLLVK